MKYAPYPKYKASGVEWLGDVPVGWEVVKVKHMTSKVGSGKTPSGGASIYQDSGIVFLRSQNVYDEGLKLDDVVYISEEIDCEMQFSRVQPGDVLLNITGASLGRTCRVPLNFPQANVNQHVCVLRFKQIALFASWTVKSSILKAQIAIGQSGAAREGLNFEEIRALIFVLPPFPEQQIIAAFLDQQCGHIDSLIEKKRRMLELLDEKRRALITQAVTRGLDTTVPMKDSGVEWLGKVPVGWEVKRLGIITESIQTGPFGTQLHFEDYIEHGTPVINPAHLQNGKIIPDYVCSVGEKDVLRLIRHILHVDDIIFARRGEMGRCAKVTVEDVGYLCGTGCLQVRFTSRALSSFFASYLQTDFISNYLKLESVGSTMDNLNTKILAKTPIVFPPLSEQQAIADYLDTQTTALDKQRKSIETSIELLREYRASLITHAVTGKIDVRNFSPAQ